MRNNTICEIILITIVKFENIGRIRAIWRVYKGDKVFKYEIVYNDLMEKINAGEFNDRMLPTEAEITSKYGVSRITAQKAFEMLEKDKLIVRVAGKGTMLLKRPSTASDSKKLIGVVLCDVDSAFGMELLLSIESEANRHGYSIILKRSHDDPTTEDEILTELNTLQVSGIIIQNCHGDFTKGLMRLSCSDFPIVSVDRRTSRLPICSVTSDNSQAMILATEYLFQLGHNNILLLSANPNGTSSLSRRIEGFRQCYINNKKQLTQYSMLTNLISPITLKKEDEARDCDAIRQRLERCPETTAIVACERRVGALAQRVISSMNKSCPEDYSLICFDHEESYMGNGIITHVKQDQTAMGKKAVEMLIAVIEGNKEIRREEVASNLVIGASTSSII